MGGCYRSCQLAAHAHATSRQGLGWGGFDVHVNLPPTHMPRHARVVGGGECASVHVSLPPKYLYFCLSDVNVNVLYDLYIYYTYIYIMYTYCYISNNLIFQMLSYVICWVYVVCICIYFKNIYIFLIYGMFYVKIRYI